MGPKQPASTVLTKEEEALIVTSRRLTLLPLDDGLYALQATTPRLTRSARHRGLKRPAISRLPATEGDNPQKKPFKSTPLGYFPIDIAEVHTEAGKLDLLVSIDRTSRFAYAELHTAAIKMVAAQCLRHLMAGRPDQLHPVLTDPGIQVTNRKQAQYAFSHLWARLCEEHASAHRLAQSHYPGTNGQGERMNRSLKEAPGKNYDDQTHQHLKEHLHAFLMAYNFAKQLNTLRRIFPPPFSWIPRKIQGLVYFPCHDVVM